MASEASTPCPFAPVLHHIVWISEPNVVSTLTMLKCMRELQCIVILTWNIAWWCTNQDKSFLTVFYISKVLVGWNKYIYILIQQIMTDFISREVDIRWLCYGTIHADSHLSIINLAFVYFSSVVGLSDDDVKIYSNLYTDNVHNLLLILNSDKMCHGFYWKIYRQIDEVHFGKSHHCHCVFLSCKDCCKRHWAKIPCISSPT